MRSEAAESSRETVRMKDARAREGWKGGGLEERRFCRTTSRWPRAVNSGWGGLRRSSLVVRPRMVMYPRRMALRRVELEGERAEGAGDVRGEGSVFEVGDRRSGRVDGEGGDQWGDIVVLVVVVGMARKKSPFL